jgi:hypothetical protein
MGKKGAQTIDPTPKLFEVEFVVRVVVVAADEEDANRTALKRYRDIMFDGGDPAQPLIKREIASVGDLPAGWDGGCLPYGDHCNETIQSFLRRTARRKPTP